MGSVFATATRLGRAAGRRVVSVGLAPVGSVVSVATSAPLVALTFDDGPDPRVTPQVLDVLDQRSSTATFFVLLTRVNRHPELIGEISRRGHEVALHGPDHRRLTQFGRDEVADRLEKAREELTDLAGAPVRWFRPPYGAQTLSTAIAIRRTGLTPVLWGPSLWDWKDCTAADRRARAMSGLRPGSIVLGHDGIAGPSDGDPNGRAPDLDRAEWLAEMLDAYGESGLGGRSLGEVVRSGRVVVRARLVR